jgi:cell division inhibitor SulA
MSQEQEPQKVFHISITIASAFKDTMETSLTTGDYELVRAFIAHLVNNCNAEIEEAAKPKSQIITLN